MSKKTQKTARELQKLERKVTKNRHLSIKKKGKPSLSIVILILFILIATSVSMWYFYTPSKEHGESDRRNYDRVRTISATLAKDIQEITPNSQLTSNDSCTIVKPRLYGDKEQNNCTVNTEIRGEILAADFYKDNLRKSRNINLTEFKSDTSGGWSAEFNVRGASRNKCFINGSIIKNNIIVKCTVETKKPYSTIIFNA